MRMKKLSGTAVPETDGYGNWRLDYYTDVPDHLRGEDVVVPCQVCGTEYRFQIDRRHKAGLFCSDACRSRRQAAERKEARAKAVAPRHCAWCGTVFTPRRPHARQCSALCRKHAERARRKGFAGERFTSRGDPIL